MDFVHLDKELKDKKDLGVFRSASTLLSPIKQNKEIQDKKSH